MHVFAYFLTAEKILTFWEPFQDVPVIKGMTNFMPSIAVKAETVIDDIQDGAPPEDLHLQPYLGYTTPDKIIIRGRALEADVDRASEDTPSMVDNLSAMVALSKTQKVAGEIVSLGQTEARSNEQGYYEIVLKKKNPRPGWTKAVVKAERTGEITHHPVLITSPKAKFGVISDIDDTVLQTKAWSTRKTLWTSVTGSVGSRYVYPDATTLLKIMAGSMSGTKNPVFYVSATPWNLHGFLDAVFMANGVVRGPKFLNDISLNATKIEAEDHVDHKEDAVATVLDANPDLPFYLIGDSGQNDPAVYANIVQTYPGRIKGVFIRTSNAALTEPQQSCLNGIEAKGVRVFTGETFEPLLDQSF